MMFRYLLALAAVGFPSASASGISEERNLNQCPGQFVNEEYKVEIELYNIADGCNATDFLEMGKIVKAAVAKADDCAPKFDEDFVRMRTTMCEVPDEVAENAERFLLENSERRLGRYAILYLGGGVCRRCRQDNGDRRHLRKGTGQKRFLTGKKEGGKGKSGGKSGCRMDADTNKRTVENAAMEADEVFDETIRIMMISGRDDSELVDLFQKAKTEHQRSNQALHRANRASVKIDMLCREADGDEDAEEILLEASSNSDVISESSKEATSALTELQRVNREMKKKARSNNGGNTCHMAELAQHGKADAETAVERLGPLVSELVAAAEGVDDERTRDEFIRKAEEKVKECKTCVEKASTSFDAVASLCEMAQSTTESHSKLKRIAEDAERYFTEAMDNGQEARQMYYDVKDIIVEVKKEIFNQEHDSMVKLTKKATESDIEAFEDEIQAASREIEKVSQEWKSEKDDTKKAELKSQLDVLENEIAKLEMDLKRLKFDTTDKLEWEKEMAHSTFEVEGASSQKEWQEKFSELVTQLLQRRLFEEYGLPDGCLDDSPFADVYIYKVGVVENMGDPQECNDI